MGQIAQMASVSLGLLFTEVLIFAAPALLVLRGANLRASFLRPRPPPPAVLGIAALLAVANFPLAGGMASAGRALAEMAAKTSWGPRWLDDLIRLSDVAERILSTQDGVWRVLVIVAACLAAPVCEELAFRGVIQPAFSARWGALRGVVVAAALFSLMHANPILFPALFELGIVFGLVAVRANSLSAAVLMHAIHNSITTGLLYGGMEEAFEPADLPGALEIMAVGLALTLPLLWALWNATRETARLVPEPARIDPAAPVRFRPRRVAAAAAGWIALVALALLALLATAPPGVLAPT